MENLDTERSARPVWWNDEHTSGWERVKEAFHRDWEQTKADFSKKHGKELKQNAKDTVKQAVGADPVPPADMPNPKVDKDWNKSEPAARYGYGARNKYGTEFASWDDRVELKLKKEWDEFKSDRKWDEAKPDVRAGWDYATQPKDTTPPRSTH